MKRDRERGLKDSNPKVCKGPKGDKVSQELDGRTLHMAYADTIAQVIGFSQYGSYVDFNATDVETC